MEALRRYLPVLEWGHATTRHTLSDAALTLTLAFLSQHDAWDALGLLCFEPPAVEPPRL